MEREEFVIEERRDRLLKKLYEMAAELSNVFSRDKYNKMWELCIDWNRAHEDKEIFMCEDCRDCEGTPIYYIEDDYFYYGD